MFTVRYELLFSCDLDEVSLLKRLSCRAVTMTNPVHLCFTSSRVNTSGLQIRGARAPGRLNFIPQRLIFWGLPSVETALCYAYGA